MLKLSIPARPACSTRWSSHPRVLRVVALSGGFSRPEACAELAKNPGMIASFSRALLEDLRHQMSDEEFDRSLGGAIDDIHRAWMKTHSPSTPISPASSSGSAVRPGSST
jgi:fructose-bisphosphate aldolase class I